MLIISQNLANYEFDIPENAIFRFNLAWISSLTELENLLKKHKTHTIFFDLPTKRTKPPTINYTLKELIPILKSHENIKYFAVSNVENSNDLKEYIQLLPSHIIIVPKIENAKGISNIEDITNVLPNNHKIVMLDHDDLYSSLSRTNAPVSKFKEYVNQLIDFCNKTNVKLLRTKGVIFGDDEKRIT
jgi:hypothetical protein